MSTDGTHDHCWHIDPSVAIMDIYPPTWSCRCCFCAEREMIRGEIPHPLRHHGPFVFSASYPYVDEG